MRILNIFQKMTLDDMLTTLIFSFVNIIFVGLLIFIYIKNKDKYNDLKGYIIGASIQLFSALIFVSRDLITLIPFKTGITFVANVTLLASYIIILNFLLKIVNRKIDKKYLNASFIIFSIIYLYSTLITYNATIITVAVIVSMLFTNITALFFIYYKKTKQQKARWFPYLVINILSISYVIIHFTYIIATKGEGVSAIILFNGENFLLKSVVIISTTNAIGLLATLNSAAPSYIDLENQLFSEIFHNVPFMVVAVDTSKGFIRYINPDFTKEMGYTRNEVIDKLTLEDIHYNLEQFDDLKHLYYTKRSLSSKEVTLTMKNGGKLYGSLSLTEMEFEEGTYIIASIVNISESVLRKEAYKTMALFDELTSLPNRRPFLHNFEIKLREKKKFSVMMLDLDNFKEINDTYGHVYGDETLKAVGKRLNEFNQGTDVVSRYGGDEFVLLLSSNGKEITDAKLHAVLDIFKDPFVIKDKKITVDVSIGYACYPEDGKTINSLIGKADKALYKAKETFGDFAHKYDERL